MTASSLPRVLVTRAEDPEGPLTSLLRAAGCTPIRAPSVREVACLSRTELAARLAGMETAGWLAVTSPRAVRVLDELGALDTAPPSSLRLAAAGPATASALESRGWAPQVVPDEAGAAPLARALISSDDAAPGTVLFPCSARARPELPRSLAGAGYTVVEIPVYDVRPAPQERTRWDALLAPGLPDVVTFTSPSCVHGLIRGMVDAGLEAALESLKAVPAAVQGPTTAAAAREAGWAHRLEASPRTFPGLVKAASELAAESGRFPTAALNTHPSPPSEVDA